jgi:hypothetical protein
MIANTQGKSFWTRRTLSRSVAWVCLLLFAVTLVAFGLPPTDVVSESPGSSALWISLFPKVTFSPPHITLIPLDSLKPVTIPDPILSEVLHDLCGVPMANSVTRGQLNALTADLDLTNLGVKDLEGVQYCRQIPALIASKNAITHFPALTLMTGLQLLQLDECGLTEVPSQIQGLPNLVVLRMSHNQLTVLPDFLAGIDSLYALIVDDNQIREIPTAFASSALFTLNADFNRLTTLPDSVLGTVGLSNVLVAGNRLTHVPPSMAGKDWEVLDFEFNFIDVSDGSVDRVLLDGLVAGSKSFARQLTPIGDLAAEPSSTGIRLTWTACPASVHATWSTVVTRYYVYLNEGGALSELATLDPSTTEFVESGLPASTARTYTVGVEYQVTDPFLNGITRHYVTLATATTEEVTPAPSGDATPTLDPLATPSAAADATVAPTPGTGDGNVSLPVWVLVAGGVLGTAILASLVVLIVVLVRKR